MANKNFDIKYTVIKVLGKNSKYCFYVRMSPGFLKHKGQKGVYRLLNNK